MRHSVKQMNWTQFLFTGRRLGITLSHRLSSLPPIEELALNCTLFLGSSADFYVTSANSFPWEGTPPFVVGRITFDNWVIARAMLNMTPVVDLANTIAAVHLTDGKGNYESLGVSDKYLNRDLLPSGFPHKLGSPLCAPFKTLYNVHKRQALYHRRVTFSNCKSTLTDLRLYGKMAHTGKTGETCVHFAILKLSISLYQIKKANSQKKGSVVVQNLLKV